MRTYRTSIKVPEILDQYRSYLLRGPGQTSDILLEPLHRGEC